MDETERHIRLVRPLEDEPEQMPDWAFDLPSRAIHPSVLDDYLADLRRRSRNRARLHVVRSPVIDV